jgi:hypothetical protein
MLNGNYFHIKYISNYTERLQATETLMGHKKVKGKGKVVPVL